MNLEERWWERLLLFAGVIGIAALPAWWIGTTALVGSSWLSAWPAWAAWLAVGGGLALLIATLGLLGAGAWFGVQTLKRGLNSEWRAAPSARYDEPSGEAVLEPELPRVITVRRIDSAEEQP